MTITNATVELELAREDGIQAERRRCVGVLLAEIGRHRLNHWAPNIDTLEALATVLEHPELEG